MIHLISLKAYLTACFPPRVHFINVAIRLNLAGTQFNWALLGLLTLQVYNFHVKFPNERLSLKVFGPRLLFPLRFESTKRSQCTGFFSWTWCRRLSQVTSRSACWFSVGETLVCFRNSHGLNALSPFSQGWAFPQSRLMFRFSSLGLSTLSSNSTAIHGTHRSHRRIYVLGGQTSRFVLGICGLIIVIVLLQSFPAMITGVIHANTSSQLAEIPGLILAAKICLLGSAICDVVITATMVVLLNHYRKLAPWTKTDSLLTKLIYHTVQTGAITSIVTIAEIVLFLTYPEYLYHEVPGRIHPRKNVGIPEPHSRFSDHPSIPDSSLPTRRIPLKGVYTKFVTSLLRLNWLKFQPKLVTSRQPMETTSGRVRKYVRCYGGHLSTMMPTSTPARNRRQLSDARRCQVAAARAMRRIPDLCTSRRVCPGPCIRQAVGYQSDLLKKRPCILNEKITRPIPAWFWVKEVSMLLLSRNEVCVHGGYAALKEASYMHHSVLDVGTRCCRSQISCAGVMVVVVVEAKGLTCHVMFNIRWTLQWAVSNSRGGDDASRGVHVSAVTELENIFLRSRFQTSDSLDIRRRDYGRALFQLTTLSLYPRFFTHFQHLAGKWVVQLKALIVETLGAISPANN
ncbi:hypothetical protein K438DRAFT_1775840 [Mycena galopus ATCC 62051]|nr:hypothetical protein K438DRAFT_1775840 [Mycena galopus ATCC 62051]